MLKEIKKKIDQVKTGDSKMLLFVVLILRSETRFTSEMDPVTGVPRMVTGACFCSMCPKCGS